MKQPAFSKILAFIITNLILTQLVYPKPPQLTIIFIVDQFAYNYIDKVKPHLTGGINDLLKNGMFYKNMYMPHCHPATGSGHVTISTGVTPNVHGVVGNAFSLSNGQKNYYEKFKYGAIVNSVFSPDGLYKHGVSAKNIMVDNISDQFALQERPGQKCQVFAVSHKSRASVGCAGKLGKAVWFDKKGRQFTSSKAYFDQLPDWIINFNRQYMPKKNPKNLEWKLFFPKSKKPYNFKDVDDYSFATHPFKMIGTDFSKITNIQENEYGEIYIKSPHANQHLLDLSKECLEANLTKNQNDRFLLWISLSPLDALGHYYGPQSKEVLDMIYHLDWQMKKFMQYVSTKVSPNKTLYILASDHGIMPIPELLQKQGLKNVHRINDKEIVDSLNKYIEKKHEIANVMSYFLNANFYLNKKVFYALSPEKRRQVATSIKAFLKKQPGIREIWTFDELKNLQIESGTIDSFFKNQIYKGRSGDFICKCHPYSVITKHRRGTSHRSPYEYDTHVPLVIYQRGKYASKTFEQKVFMTQLANTLAKIFNIQKPSASTENVLPGF